MRPHRPVFVASACALVLASVTPSGVARAEPPAAEVRALVARALGPHLKPREIERLLEAPRVQRALDELFEGWDGVADVVTIEKRGDEVVLHTLIRERRCLAHLELGPEAAEAEPQCEEVVRVDGDRELVLDGKLWRPKAPPRPKQKRGEPAVADGGTPAPEPSVEVVGPVDNTVLRRRSQYPVEDGPVLEARAAHEALKDVLRRPHWKDPLLPKDAVEAGEAIRPFEVPEPAKEARVDTNLRNPFGEGRLRTDLPVPDMLTLPPSDNAMPLLPAMREACTDEWRLRTDTPEPPTLDCYRRVAWHDRLEDNDVYQALSRIASVIKLPLLDTLVEIQVKDAVSHQAHRLAWALVWVAWVKDHPERTADALERLTPEERRFVRRRLADWWVESKLATLRPTITRLFERHFLGLYPEAADLDGLPRRTFLADTWLWANNWLAILDAREPDAIAAAFARLTHPERRVIAAFVKDRDLSKRWSHAAEVIAGL